MEGDRFLWAIKARTDLSDPGPHHRLELGTSDWTAVTASNSRRRDIKMACQPMDDS